MTVQQRATLDDVARLAGVSSKTVSRVFAQRELVAHRFELLPVAASRFEQLRDFYGPFPIWVWLGSVLRGTSKPPPVSRC